MVHWNSREKKKKLTHIQPAVLSWAFWQDLPVRLLALISSYSIHTLQEQAKDWVLFHCEPGNTHTQSQGIYVEEAGEPHFRIKDVICRGMKGVSRVVLLEVMLCFLQSPQSAQQHTSLHHGAGIGLGSHVRQVILHRQPDGKSRWTCTPCYIQL